MNSDNFLKPSTENKQQEEPPTISQTDTKNTAATIIPEEENTDIKPPSITDENLTREQILDLIPEEYYIEAAMFEEKCNTTEQYYNYRNCSCLAKKFFEERIVQGPYVTQQDVIAKLEEECIDATFAAGDVYQDCVTNGSVFPAGKDPYEFCECVGNKFAEVFQRYKLRPNSKSSIRAQSKAQIECSYN